MADNEEASRLKKEIAYLSDLIKNAKKEKTCHGSNQFIRGQFHKSYSEPQHHFHNLNSRHSFVPCVPFPKSSKYVAPQLKVTSSALTKVNNSAYTNSIPASSTNTSGIRSGQFQVDSLNNARTISTTQTDKACPEKTSSSIKINVHVNPKFLQKAKSMSSQLTECSSAYTGTDHFLQATTKISNVNKCSNISPGIQTLPDTKNSFTKVVPNPKALHAKKLRTTESIQLKITKRKSSQGRQILPESTSNTESQIKQLRRELGYEIPPVSSSTLDTIPKQTKKLHKELGCEVLPVSTLNSVKLQKQIQELRKTLGYEIPPLSSAIKSIPVLICPSGSSSNGNSTNLKLSKFNTVPNVYSNLRSSPKNTTHGSTSPYKIDKTTSRSTRTSKDSKFLSTSSLSKFSNKKQNEQSSLKHATLTIKHHPSKYVLNNKLKSSIKLSPKIIKSRFKYIVKSNSSENVSKTCNYSKTQIAAKTIISKYKIRKGSDIKKDCTLPSRRMFDNKYWKSKETQDDYNYITSKTNYWTNRIPHQTSLRNTCWNKGIFPVQSTNAYSWRKGVSFRSRWSRRPHNGQFYQPIQTRKLSSQTRSAQNTSLKPDTRQGKKGRLVFINGYLYRSTKQSITKTGSKKVDHRIKSSVIPPSNKSSTTGQNAGSKQLRTVRVRGVTFKMASDGHSLHRIEQNKNNLVNKDKVKVTRVDIGGVTYIQTKPGTLVKMATTRSRLVTSRVINKSISVVTNKQRKKVNKQYCMFYNRFGRCRRGGNCPFIHDPDKIVVCTRFLRGTCKVKDCLFSHHVSEDKMPVCSYFLKGCCDKVDCPYLHVKVNQNAAICLAFVQGHCPNGRECKKLHTRSCAEYSKTGSCRQGKQCPLEHKRKKSKQKKTAITNSILPSTHTSGCTSSSTESNGDNTSNKLPSYISLTEYSSPNTSTPHRQRYIDTPIDTTPLLIKPRL